MTKRIKRMIWHIFIALAGGYVLLAALLFVFQGKLVYRPTAKHVATPMQHEHPMDYEDVWLEASDGVKLHGWFLPVESSKGTVLMFHGNGGNVSHRLETIAIFHDLGYNAMIIDYRGYGRSEGSPGEHGTYRDAEAAWKYLISERKLDPKRIVIFGRSLGSAVAAWLAVEKQSAGLILESAFTSIPDMGAELYKFLPVRLLARIKYDTFGRIKQVRCPLLIIHSPDDEIIPYHHGQKLFAAANEPKRFLEISGGHNDGFMRSGKTYTGCLAEFLESAISSSAGDD
ncbi:MAG: alpha/beta hydrolase [Phycisphaerae bacterium]|nr:alpha/beta hydrolase [Phycisphaerae bacterium]